MARWQERALDAQRGRPPLIREVEHAITFEFGVLGGVLVDELFVPTPRTRVSIRCHRSGTITMRILEGRSSGR